MTNVNNQLKKKILIVDDDPNLLRLLGIRLSAAGYNVESAASAKIALGILKSFQPHMVISDLRMEGMDGMALFEQIRNQYPHMPVVIMTAHGTIPDAINATKQGVFSFLTKPFESQELLDTVQKAIQLQPSITQKIPKESSWRAKIISRSAIMESLLQQTNQVAQSDFSLLIHSASGTGKELLAKAIHQASNRHNKPFTAINCAAIPEQLLESELFGHAKGAFTGAGKNHVGLFQATDGGTLFLDEIGDMPMSFQVKLLRALQEKEIRPVGSTQSIKVDVRIISATHKNLQQAIIDKTFREDLYYRLNV
ncbi:MAG: sigma-54 dependent transcriptional regulator, partial [Colwellia sp.]|nr:sigma-54 dependent transcriptional regulator [Colwellia sp.]